MDKDTKTCSIIEEEIVQLMHFHASNTMYSDMQYAIERINYLNKRLKADKKEAKEETKAEGVTTPMQQMEKQDAAKLYGYKAEPKPNTTSGW